MKRLSQFLLSACVMGLLAAPAMATDEAHHLGTVEHPEDHVHAHPKWGYTGDLAFQHWGDLDESYAACKDGLKQSPINISKYEEHDLPDIEPAYQAVEAQVTNNGHSIHVDLTGAGSFAIGDARYSVLQANFHTPSEHYIDGSPYPMSVHFMHQAEDGTLAVIGVMMEVGAEPNPAIGKLWSAIGGEPVPLSPDELMPIEDDDDMDYYAYEGSLTTPPCSEGVKWHVLEDSISISETQLLAFQSLFPNNARPIQPLHGRVVKGDD